MVENTLEARSAFTRLDIGATSDFEVSEREDVTMASIATSEKNLDDVQHAVKQAYGVELPGGPKRIAGKDIEFIWFGPDQWLALAPRADGRDLEVELKALLPNASIVDQSDGRVIVRISGERARDVLAKGVPIDLHPQSFSLNDAAVTHASHIGIILWQTDGAPTFEIALFRSYADSFSDWLIDSAAEFTSWQHKPKKSARA